MCGNLIVGRRRRVEFLGDVIEHFKGVRHDAGLSVSERVLLLIDDLVGIALPRRRVVGFASHDCHVPHL